MKYTYEMVSYECEECKGEFFTCGEAHGSIKNLNCPHCYSQSMAHGGTFIVSTDAVLEEN